MIAIPTKDGINGKKTTGEFHKVWFANGSKRTAALVIKKDKLEGKTIADISRYYPYFESGKMNVLFVSPGYDTFEIAFNTPIQKSVKWSYGTNF
jgi:hypothetical protein